MHRNTGTGRPGRDRCPWAPSNRLIYAGALALLGSLGSIANAQALPPVQFPPENPFSVEKSTLGKMLFWDEQLSSDNTMSCGTCHIHSSGGGDPQAGHNPGLDGLFGNADDVIGSFGVSLFDGDDRFVKSPAYGLMPQTTGRLAQPSIMAMYAPDLFWDGRATDQFVDPQTGQIVIQSGGALESQAVEPILSSVEMAHSDRSWEQVIEKLTHARPMALATDLTPDMQGFVLTGASYPELFELAFGDEQITAARIGMAIATYERTLVPDQTPFDAFVAGDQQALTNRQQNGLNAFNGSRCSACHIGAQFTGNGFRNIGLRPIAEDSGRFEVTNNPPDRGRFKVPSLRNVGLRDRFMHNGQLADLDEVFDFYARRNGQVSFAQNRDGLLNVPIVLGNNAQANLTDFLINGLTDPRVANEEFPFDRPMLHSEQPAQNPQTISDGVAGSGGAMPTMVALSPPNLGNRDFKLGIDSALGGAQAWVVVSNDPPSDGVLAHDELLGPITLEGIGTGEGYGTMAYPIPNIVGLDGQSRYMQWRVSDPGAPDGFAASPIVEVRLFCTMHGTCTDHCPADLTSDGILDFFDVSAFLDGFGSQAEASDFTDDGVFDFFDVSAFLDAFGSGCS